MPASSPEALARKRQRDAERRRVRQAEDPDFARILKIDASRRKRRARGLPVDAPFRERQAPRPRPSERPFIGCDGEGCGERGEHRYALFRMGERELYRDGRRLRTPEILDFIVNQEEEDVINVAFAFEYDVSNILRDVPSVRSHPDKPSRLEKLLSIDVAYLTGQTNPYAGHRWTWLSFDGFPDFGVDYLPRNHLRVCLGEKIKLTDGTFRRIAKPGTIRTIYDTFGFFQASFLKSINDWEVGAKHWERIKFNKANRENFSTITQEIRDYCAIECDLLAELMTRFRDTCHAAGIRPRTWNGAGKIASALLREHGALTGERLAEIVPAPVMAMAHAAYYGGRFEVTRIGRIGQRVFEHDIRSAYPAAMVTLSCLEHARWVKTSAAECQRYLDTGIEATFVCPMRFEHPVSGYLNGLPFRDPKGRLSWPRAGNGVYWSIEAQSAKRLGATITCRAGWRLETRCSCPPPMQWVEELYEERRKLPRLQGVPIKLGINSLYGKTAQRIGRPRYANPVYAGLITAMTRAKLNDAIAACPRQDDVVMIATDALYTIRRKAKVEEGERLGQWECKTYKSLFVVRPGLYWPPKPRGKAWRIKSRGLSPRFFESRCATFQRRWRSYLRRSDVGEPEPSSPDTPVVPVPVETFIGLRLAFRLGKPDMACQWVRKAIECRFAYHDKREGATFTRDRKGLILGSKAGSPSAYSTHYEPGSKRPSWVEAWGDERNLEMLTEAMPDVVDLTPPWRE